MITYTMLDDVFKQKNMDLEITQELLDEAQEMQKDKQSFVYELLKSNKTLDYHSATEVYWCLKVTELKQQIRGLREELLPLG